MGTVYLIHFGRKYKHARHYIGWTGKRKLDERITAHRENRGARLLAVVNAAGIPWEVVRVWTKVTREFERKLKKRKCSRRYCPHCKREATG
jgi:predicted GIY-YIG superfamily endonuclease